MVSNRDFRKLDMATQAELRRVAVGMVQAGKTRAEAAATVGVGRRYVGEWVGAVEASGEGALGGGGGGRERRPELCRGMGRRRRAFRRGCAGRGATWPSAG